MTLPPLTCLPYENSSFYQTLFQILSVAQIIEIFTYLLFERSVIIVAHDIENLLPVIFALKSFLYPLRVCMIIPLLFNDGEDFYNNLLSQVVSVISDSTVFGIQFQDLAQVKEYIVDDDDSRPLFVQLDDKKLKSGSRQQGKSKLFHYQDDVWKDISMEMLEKKRELQLPEKIYKELLKKIERAMKFPSIKLQSPLLGFNPVEKSDKKRN